MKPIVSVIVPIFNGSHFLEETLESLRIQSCRDIEIILVDDCSTDNSLKIIRRYVSIDNRFKLFVNERNGGVSFSTNIGIKKAIGKYIAFHDHDDVMLPEKLSVCSNLLDNNEDIDGVITVGRYIKEDGTDTGLISELPASLTANPYLVRSFERSYIPTWAMFLRRDLIGDLTFDENIKVGNQDYDLFLRLLYKRSRFIYYDKPLIKFRLVARSLSRSFNSYPMKNIYDKHREEDIFNLYTLAGYHNSIAYYALAKINIFRGKFRKALGYISLVDKDNRIPESEVDEFVYLWATCLFLNNSITECEKKLDLLEDRQYKAEVLNNRAVCLARKGELKLSLQCLEDSLMIFPSYKDARNNFELLKRENSIHGMRYTVFPIRQVYRNLI